MALAFLVWVGLAFATAAIAMSKGRSFTGWLLLGFIFPISILFVLIAADRSSVKSSEGGQEPDLALAQIYIDPNLKSDLPQGIRVENLLGGTQVWWVAGKPYLDKEAAIRAAEIGAET